METSTYPGTSAGGSVGEQVREGAQQVGEQVQQARDTVQETASRAVGQAQEQMGRARGQVREQVDQRLTQAGERVGTTAQDLRTVASELRRIDKGSSANVAEQLAQRAEGVGRYLDSADAEKLLHDVEDFGRRQPWAVLAGGLALGFIASRVLKASSGRRYGGTSTGSNTSTRSREEIRAGLTGAPPAPYAPQ